MRTRERWPHLQIVSADAGPLMFGLDETIEQHRRRPRGMYRDAVRFLHRHFVKAMGLRRLSLMWLIEIPWAGRVWALHLLAAGANINEIETVSRGASAYRSRVSEVESTMSSGDVSPGRLGVHSKEQSKRWM